MAPQSTMYEKIRSKDFYELVSTGGCRIRHLHLEGLYFQTKNYLTGCMNGEPFVLAGKFDLFKFIFLLCDVCNKLEHVKFVIPDWSYNMFIQYGAGLCEPFQTLIERNKGITRFWFHAPDKDFMSNVLQALPQSVTEVSIRPCETETDVICEVSFMTILLCKLP